MKTASAPSLRSCSTVSATPPSRPASAAWSIKDRPAATGCQFTFTCDGSLNRGPDAAGWRRATAIAEAALDGAVYAPVGWATHYHADYVVPYWASTMAKNAVVGAHIFYRWAGGWGQPGSVQRSLCGHEPNASALRDGRAGSRPCYRAEPGRCRARSRRSLAPRRCSSPSMRGDKRVAVRFKLAARKASDEATHEDYSRKFDASDNLKWCAVGRHCRARTRSRLAAATGSRRRPAGGIGPTANQRCCGGRRRSGGPSANSTAAGCGRGGRRSPDNRRKAAAAAPFPAGHRELAERSVVAQADRGSAAATTASSKAAQRSSWTGRLQAKRGVTVAARVGQRHPHRGCRPARASVIAAVDGGPSSGPVHRVGRSGDPRMDSAAERRCTIAPKSAPGRTRAAQRPRRRRPPAMRGRPTAPAASRRLQPAHRWLRAASSCGRAWREFAIGAVDLGSAAGVSAVAVGMMVLDQPFVGAFDRREVRARAGAQERHKRTRRGHRRRSNPLHADMESGASDGTRTRDLRRDRPAL